MTDRVNISPGHTNLPPSTAKTFLYGGGEFVATGSLIADLYGDLAAGPYEAFDHIGSNGLDVTIDTGEAIAGGAVLARDTQTTVSLNASTSNQTVYVGWATDAQDTVIIGPDSAFSSTAHRTPIWEFDTDASSVTNARDERYIDPQNAESDMWHSRVEANNTFVSKSGGGLSDDLNFQQHQALNMLLDHRTQSTRPSNPADMQIWVRNDTNPPKPVIQHNGDLYQFAVEPWGLAVDDFDGAGLLGWHGNINFFQIQGSIAYEGSAVRGEDDGTYQRIISSYPGDGLRHYPQAGDTWEVIMRANDAQGKPNLFWCAQQNTADTAIDNGYYIDFQTGQGDVEIFRYESGSGATSICAATNASFGAGEWVRIEIDHQTNGDITVTVDPYGGASDTASGNDSTYSSGGVQLRRREAGDQFWDEFQITSPR